MKRFYLSTLVSLLSGLAVCTLGLSAAGLPEFDFTAPAGREGWRATHDITQLTPTAEGLLVEIGGADPYLHGPARDYPEGVGLWLKLRLKSDQAGTCQVFFFPENGGASEARSIRFHVPAADWFESRAFLPPLGPRYRLRIDPPGTSGRCLLGFLRLEERTQMANPVWPKPEAPNITSDNAHVRSGGLQLAHGNNFLGEFELRVGNELMAAGNSAALIGYVRESGLRWLSWRKAVPLQIDRSAGSLSVRGSVVDDDGGRWEMKQHFASGPLPGTIRMETQVTVSHDRMVAYLPLFTLLPGLGNFGTNKTQALLAGVEYLENEPSSSEADLRGPAAQRQVPDHLKLTFPLMALSAKGRYFGLIWEPEPKHAAYFDSPDRLYHSGASVMGLLFPGSDGTNRDESQLLPYGGEWLRARQPLVVRATIIGGAGETVVPAVQHYVALRGMPPVPSPGLTADEYFTLASRSWLDSRIREGDLYRHAFWPGFGAQKAADAALWMDWLATQVKDASLGSQLTAAAAGALRQVAPGNYNSAGIGHIRYPAPALVYGAAQENAASALRRGRDLLRRFRPDGTVLYEKSAKGIDYGATHYARHANGLTAQVMLSLLESAIFANDQELIAEGLNQLRKLEQYRGTVPRGAQTWEVPLHTPDILASAHLVRAYVLGYELTRQAGFLEQAKYWAWTGVPFVYLRAPTDRPIGAYATIPVLGATSWVAPVWIGLPVQWCGLVYAEALYELLPHDAAGPWKQLADGITAAGMQMTWPDTDQERQGLLPDIFQLRAQMRDGPAINPITVLAPAVRYWNRAAPYDFRSFARCGLLVHAPGEIEWMSEDTKGATFRVKAWARQPYQVLVNGAWKEPEIKINGQAVAKVSSQYEFDARRGRLSLQLVGDAVVELK
jgi:hypothetical protein